MEKYPDWPPRTDVPALSHSNIQLYERCRRKWFLQYKRDFVPRDVKFDIMIQRQLMPVTMLAGAVVDAVVKMAMRRYITHGTWRPDLKSDARKALAAFVDYSRLFTQAVDNHQPWPERKYTWLRPLDMAYYDGDVSEAQISSTLHTIDTCLENFVDFLHAEDLYEADPSGWRIPESGDKPNPWFWHDDIPVYAGYDFAVIDGDALRIIDWKAGRSERAESSAREQLVGYATFAHHEWNFNFDAITLHAVWLQEGNKTTGAKADTETVGKLKNRWKTLYAEQSVAVAQVAAQPSRYAEIFPECSDVMACYFCQYRSCTGRTRLRTMHDEVVRVENAGFTEEDYFA